MSRESIAFTKMQGTGNDFIIIDNREGQYTLAELIKITPVICHRRFGAGADGLLALNHPEHTDLDYTMVYRNADGSDAGMCGNGSRCLALFASRQGLGNSLKFNVHDDKYTAEVKDSSQVRVTFPGTVTVNERNDDDSILYEVHPGTEHVVRKVAEPTLKNEKQLVIEGQRLRKHEMFKPKGTNVNFMCCTGEDELTIHTYERGVEDLTFACGTGAIASAMAWHHIQKSAALQNTYDVNTKGGTLKVRFTYTQETGSYTDIQLEGPAHFVYEGTFYV